MTRLERGRKMAEADVSVRAGSLGAAQTSSNLPAYERFDGNSGSSPLGAFSGLPTYTRTRMGSSLKFVLPTAVAAIVGFMLGWSLEFDRLVDAHRPDGCDGPCLFLASEFHDDALLAGVVGAVVCGLFVFGLVVLVLARRRSAPRSSRGTPEEDL